MKTIFYDAKNNIHWKLPSRERLFLRLGEYDTMAEFVVLAERYFEAQCSNAESYVDFVNAKAVEYDVKIRSGVTLNNYREALYKSFIVNSHAIFNDFINNFENDMRLFVNHDFKIERNRYKSTYDNLMVSINKTELNPQIPEWLNNIATYYRLIRNHVAHNEDDEAKCFVAYKEIDLEQMYVDYPIFKSKAPNPPGKITMDDFYLYSASIKHIANLLTISIQGHEKWADIGTHHPRLQRANIPKGTNKRKLVNQIMNELGRKCIKKEIDGILANVRLQYEK